MHALARSLSLVLAVALVGCAEPQLPEQPTAEGVEPPTEEPTPQPERDELVAVVDELIASIERAGDLLLEASEASRLSAARDAAERALAQLVVGAGAGTPAGAAVFPSDTNEARGGNGEADDALTHALTTANEAGGTLGRTVTGALSDPLAGDLGAWQRDPAGMFALAQAAADEATSLEAAERAVRDLPGEGTRAIAWTVLTVEADTQTDAAAYAERGATHLNLAVAGLRAALEADAEDGS